MNEMQRILKGSINEFKDKINNCVVRECELLHKDFNYILQKDFTFDCCCAIHTTVEKVQRNEGYYTIGMVEINTQENLFKKVISENGIDREATFLLIEYKKYKIMVHNDKSFNEVAKTYHYDGEILQDKNYSFLIENDVTQNLASNSSCKLLDFSKKYNYKMFPSYLGNLETGEFFVSFEVADTKWVNSVEQIGKEIKQVLVDNVTFKLYNATILQQQEFMLSLDEQARKEEYFGLTKRLRARQIQNEVQNGFFVKTNVVEINAEICYSLKTEREVQTKYINIAKANIRSL